MEQEISKYELELRAKLASSTRKLNDAIAAKAFVTDVNGAIAIDIIDNQIELLTNQIKGYKPLDMETYLSVHGELRGLIWFKATLQGKIDNQVTTAQEVGAISEQLQQFETDKSAE